MRAMKKEAWNSAWLYFSRFEEGQIEQRVIIREGARVCESLQINFFIQPMKHLSLFIYMTWQDTMRN